MTGSTGDAGPPERCSPEWWDSAPLQRMIFEGPHDGKTVGYHGDVLLMPPAQQPKYILSLPEASSLDDLLVAEYRIGRVDLGHGEIVAAYRYVGTR